MAQPGHCSHQRREQGSWPTSGLPWVFQLLVTARGRATVMCSVSLQHPWGSSQEGPLVLSCKLGVLPLTPDLGDVITRASPVTGNHRGPVPVWAACVLTRRGG